MQKERILFLTASYHTVNFFKNIIKKIKERPEQHEVRFVCIHSRPKEDLVDGIESFQEDWGNFEFNKIEEFDPTRIVVFNGHFKEIHAATKVLSLNYNVSIVECAWLPQNDYIYFDHNLAFNGSMCADLQNFIKTIRSYATQEMMEMISNQLHKKMFELRQKYKDTGTRPKDLPVDYILVPLQLEYDTVILYGSHFFKSMSSLIGFIKQELPKEKIVIKHHPKEQLSTINSIMEMHKDLIHITDKNITLNDLAIKARMMVGINSTGLHEGIVHHIPTIMMGKSLLHNPGNNLSFLFDKNKKENTLKISTKNLKKLYENLLHDKVFLDLELIEMVLANIISNQIDFTNPPDWAVDMFLGVRDRRDFFEELKEVK